MQDENRFYSAFGSEDALGDVAYIVEGKNALVGIELPSFTAGLDAWKGYVQSLGKPMNDIFLDAHVTGASYVSGMNIYGTQAAKDAIASGSTLATTDGLYQTFGSNFHGGSDMAQVNTVVSGKVTVGGIEFNIPTCWAKLSIPSCPAPLPWMLCWTPCMTTRTRAMLWYCPATLPRKGRTL